MRFILSLALFALTAAAPPPETVKGVFNQAIPNLPGKRLVAARVEYPPAGASLPHRHAPSAFIFAYVLSGEIRSAVDGAPPRIYHPGESWAEPPGAHHVISENASRTRPATLLAVFVVDGRETNRLVRPDRGAPPHRH